MTLIINLLGTPKIYLDDQVQLRFRTRKAQALIMYLAVTNRSWSRDALATLFWPNTDDASARKNLRDILPLLRRRFGEYLLIEEDNIGLNPMRQFKCDVTQFSAVMEEQLATVDISSLAKTLDLYQGEFLEGYSSVRISADFELWVLREREHLHQLALIGFTTLCQRQQQAGAYDAAISTNRRLLRLAPWDEATHRRQMLMLAQSGQQTAAMAHFETVCQILAEELDIKPDQETAALYKEIRAGTFRALPEQVQLQPETMADTTPSNTQADDSAPPHNLLAPLATFIGRQKELAFIAERLSAPDCRLLTITGLGGMGKSSLALAAGQQLLAAPQSAFPDGIFWVPLADINVSSVEQREQMAADDMMIGEMLLYAIAEELSTQPTVNLSSIQQLHLYLRTRTLLLILDELEHLLAGVDALISLLTKAPHVKVIVTSRARLNIRGETMLTLDKLSLLAIVNHAVYQSDRPEEYNIVEDEGWRTSEAVTMFVQRAQQVDPDFALDAETIGPVVRICYLVEGLPLGIELATSMLPLLPCDELAAELADNLHILETDLRDIPSDQRTLAAVFERSWRLLSPQSQILLARLAIFPASFSREAATTIADVSLITLKKLIDQSLVNQTEGGRYLLHRTIHEFAQQKLRQWPQQVAALEVEFSHYYLRHLSAQEQTFTGTDHAKAAEEIQRDLHNIHTALRLGVKHRMYTLLKDSVIAILLFYDQYGRFRNAFTLLDEMITQLQENEDQSTRAADTIADPLLTITRLQIFMGLCHIRLGRIEEAHAAYQTTWERLQHHYDPKAAALCASLWGVSLRQTDPQRSIALLSESRGLAKVSNTAWIEIVSSQGLGETNLLLGNYTVARQQAQDGYAKAAKLRWPRSLTTGQKAMGLIALMIGDYRSAEVHFQKAATIARQALLQHLYLECILLLGVALSLQQRFAEAEKYFAESHTFAKTFGEGIHFAPVFWEKGCLAEQRHEYAAAKALFVQSMKLGLPNWWAHALPTFGWVLIALGELDEAQSYFQSVYTDAKAHQRHPVSLDAQAGLLCIAQGTAEDKTLAAIKSDLQQIHQHPATTQQTRVRIEQILQK